MASFQKKNGRWLAQVAIQGVRKNKTFDKKAKANDWARSLETEVRSGEYFTTRESKISLRELFDRFSKEVSPSRPGGHWESLRLKNFNKSELADIFLHELTAEHIAEWRDTRLTQVQGATVRREMYLMSGVLTLAKREWGYAVPEAITLVRKPKDNPHRDRRVSDEERKEIIQYLGHQPDQPITNKPQLVATMFLLALETAMRLGEICSLRPEHVNMADCYLTLPKTKNNDRRKVPLSNKAKHLVKQYHGTDLRLSSDHAGKLFAKAVKTCEIDDLHFHDSRHEALTTLAQKIDVLDLARMVGHRNLNSLLIYYNATPKEISDRLNS